MGVLEIVLIILGIVLIVSSSLMIEKQDKNNSNNSDNNLYSSGDIEKEITILKNRIDNVMAESSDEIIYKTENYLNKLSNEKITAVSEYSDQILEKINRNHEEVVFLYQMLNDKEKELKTTVAESVSNKIKKKEQELNKGQELYRDQELYKGQKLYKGQENKDQKSNKDQELYYDKKEERPSSTKKIKKAIEYQDNENNTNNNYNQILEEYKKGKSIIEISKSLSLGQGEVKLVVDLYHEAK